MLKNQKMKILHINHKFGEVKIRIDSRDDLIPLSRIIQEADLLISKTERKIKLGGAESRQKSVKKTITLEIKVTKLIFDESNLRVQGTVTKPQEDIPIHSAHTIEVSIGSEIKLKKQKWFKYQLEQLRQAEKQSQLPKVLLCVLDDEQANFGWLTSSGLKHAGRLSLRLAKKRHAEKKSNDIEKVAKRISEMAGNLNVVIASPLFWRDLVTKSLNNIAPKVAKKVILTNVSTGSRKGLTELVSSGVVDKLLKGIEIAKHSKLVEKLLEEIAKDKLAAYGLKEVKAASDYAAVKDLLVSEKLMSRSNPDFPAILQIIDTVESTKGQAHIVSKKTDAGKKLFGLSGIAAILKFKI